MTVTLGQKRTMTTRRIEIERFSMISSKTFDAVIAALEAAVGHPDMMEFARARSYAKRPGSRPRR